MRSLCRACENAVQVSSALDVESYPTWSPDGLRLAYQASDAGYFYIGNHDIWVAQPGSGEPMNLTKDSPANDRMPSWSPDGRDIAFFSDRDGGWGLYIVAAIGGDRAKRPVVAWNRKSQLERTAVVEGRNHAFRLGESGPRERRDRPVSPNFGDHQGDAAKREGNFGWDLSVRPDGRRFAYVEGGPGATEVTRLWTIPATGGEAVPLTEGRTNVWSPTWSRDGRKVFYVSNRGGSMDLWQQAVADDGRPLGEPLAVTHGLGIRSAAFSPDGETSGVLAWRTGRQRVASASPF